MLKKILSLVSSSLAAIPIVLPIILSIIILIFRGKIVYDFLMPAELFPFTLAGALSMIILGSISQKRVKKLIVLLVLSLLNLVISQVYANFSGLAHGESSIRDHLFMVVMFIFFYHLFALLIMLECFSLTKEIWQE
ncbi:hypothetical protein [Thermotoga sp. KOL6]|uniref:hypothetical protein n=1 Tax=Thermotoga sp. KOL6 TaxID=126741 RepID=UPI000C78296E|nr:hypothetical protein [Thermotoga sp. KOL6]PLV59755.1 hypothetical protein AS005_00180 [Thermotoga sp. KOL6]